MAKKKSSLQTYSTKKAEAPAAETNGRAAKGAGLHVGLNMRMTRADWLRMRNLAGDEGTSLQALFLEGMTRVFEKRGLPPMEPVGKWGT